MESIRFVRQLIVGIVLSFLLCVQSQPMRLDYDYVVVGAGSAGSTVAGGLAQRFGSTKRILLVEAGGDDTDPNIWNALGYFDVAFSGDYSFLRWDLKTEAQPAANARKIDLPRGKVLGGTSSINGMAVVQGNPLDFDTIASATGDSSWRWTKLDQYRQEIMARLKTTTLRKDDPGTAEYIQAAKELGIKYNQNSNNGIQAGISPNLQMGYLLTPTQGIRDTPFNAFVRPLLGKKGHNIQVLTQHLVTKILINPITKKVIGVECKGQLSQRTLVFTASEEVIVSAGTYETPKLLMLSGIGPKGELESKGIDVLVELPGVGKNLRDHYTIGTFWTSLLQPNAPFAFQTPVLNVFGPEKSGPTTYQFELSGVFGSVVPLRSKSVGNVTLVSANPEDAPVINPNILSEPEDLATMVTGLKTFILPFFKNLQERGIVGQGFVVDPTANQYTDAQLEEIVKSNIASSHHPVGTAKMGSQSDPMAVVDSQFSVIGVKGLRVVDASIFPLCPSGNINAPVIVAALKAVDTIANPHAQGRGQNTNF